MMNTPHEPSCTCATCFERPWLIARCAWALKVLPLEDANEVVQDLEDRVKEHREEALALLEPEPALPV